MIKNVVKIIWHALVLNVVFLSFPMWEAFATNSLGEWEPPHLREILVASEHIKNPSKRTVVISTFFLGAPYVANPLMGGPTEAERLVVKLDGFDCFTFLDTVEALRRTRDENEFILNLINVRYKNGKVSYLNRNHFFSDWVVGTNAVVKDVTSAVSLGRHRIVKKELNHKDDGSFWVKGLPVSERVIAYIPTEELKIDVLTLLRSGDYIGVYAPKSGLDVVHTGLIIKTAEEVMIRHATSRTGVYQVTDDPLIEFMRDKAGLIVYRILHEN